MKVCLDSDHPAIILEPENDKDRDWIRAAVNAGSDRLRITGCGIDPATKKWLHMTIGIVSGPHCEAGDAETISPQGWGEVARL